MRLSHIESRIEQQLTLKELIDTAVDKLTQVGYSNISPQRVHARLTSLRENWEKFSLVHDAIGLAISQLDSEDTASLLRHSYFSESLFSATHESYLNAVEKMNLLLEQENENPHRLPSTPGGSQTSTVPSFFHHARLPRIDLPKFNGSPAEWLSFKDLFSSLVIENPTLTLVEKLQYLKTSLTGSASHLLKNTTLTADNFQKAWDALIAFYENKRLLVHAALHSLLTLKRMTKESASEMESLYTHIMQIYRSLETLQRPVQYWDDFFVFIAVQRLDAESVKAWEHTLGSSKEPPTWKQFSEFLVARMLSLQAFEKSRMSKPQNSGVIKSHFQGRAKDNTSKTISCAICKSNHYISYCPQYTSKNVQQRLAIINKQKLCYNCLGSHRASACRITKRCQKCGHKHHTTIHQARVSASDPEPTQTTPSKPSSKPADTHVLHSSTKKQTTTSVFLATAQVELVNHNEETVRARALIDQGSEISIVSERIAQLLRLPRTKSSISLVGIGAHRSNKTRGLTSFKMRSLFTSESEYLISAHILPKLTGSIPSISIEARRWPHLQDLQLADKDFTSQGDIDLILGADIYALIIQDGLVKGDDNSPIAQRTTLGWIISGPSGCNTSSPQVQGYHISLDNELYNLMHRFWDVEEIPSTTTSPLSAEDQECERHFLTTHTRNDQGHYIVRLPFKHPVQNLGDSRAKAFRLINGLSRKLENDPEYSKLYSEFMEEYEQLHHMTRVPDSQPEPQVSYYLPHHGIKRESSLTTKLRVVFNGSSRTNTGWSLNDILHIGAKLQVDLLDVLLWFRQFRYVFSSDVEKMYRQIKVHQADWKFQRIFWFDTSHRITAYQLTTVTYGLACAPFLALRSLEQLIVDEGATFPRAVPVLRKGRYVDDIFGGGDSISEAQEIATQTNKLCMAGGFPLQKWVSNHPNILQSIPTDRQANSTTLQIEDHTMTHILGMCWKISTDTFHFTIKMSPIISITKRSVLSTISKVFDPLGLISPITIKAKILIQELWSIKLGWDDPLPLNLAAKWNLFVEQLQELSHLTFPRWISIQEDHSTEIHGFCDASQRAICAAVYVRVTSSCGEVVSNLIYSKTKVAPLKRLTIPRLELSGAVILTKLVSRALLVLKLKDPSVYMWTDSAVVYTWINNHPSRWKDYVHNRVCFIQETLPHAIWRFVPGTENPADYATRGLTPMQLSKNSAWWTGPSWLQLSPSTWPQTPQLPNPRDNLEEKSTQVSVVTHHQSVEPWSLLYRYSSITRLFRITAWCMRAVTRFRRSTNTPTGPLTIQELEASKIYWVKTIQQSSFQREFSILSKGQVLPRSNPLLRLTPFMDSNGLLRIGGRLHSSPLPTDAKHPLILPRKSTFSSLIISDAHLRTIHGGTQVTLAFIRDKYWIIGGRAPIRSFILKCVKCARYRQERAQQIMGQLPIERVTPSRPFLHSGIDYAGPFLIKTWKGKNARSYKAYVSLFVCQATSAVHLELVTDYTTEGFIAAYKRFTSRRGICATLRSDCGTNLKGADAELRKLFASASEELKGIADILSKDGTQWIFNPPGAPHFGGKWEAGVKSVKFHLKRVIGDNLLTYEEMSTLLTQIEAVLNSRPLSPLSDDPNDVNALTPGHFLIGSALVTIPEPSLEAVQRTHLSRWQFNRQMLESFWKRWSRECLQRYLAVYKWNRTNPSIKEGTLVLVVDERYPPSKWPLGRVTQTYPGKDGHTRVVSIRTQTSILKRPVVKICPLPIPALIT